jgi:hypothetical protein
MGVVRVTEHLLGLSQLHHRTLGTPIPSAQAEQRDDWALLPTCTRWAVYSRADSKSFLGVVVKIAAARWECRPG